MSVLLFWVGYVAFVVLLSRGPIGELVGRVLDAPDPPPYYPPTSPARAAVEARRVPEYQPTTSEEADQ